MSHLSEVRSDQRSSRVKLGGSILAVVLLENGRQVRAKMHQLSGNGGLLHLDKPLDESIKVEVVFHVGETSFRTPAEMLFPMWATKRMSATLSLRRTLRNGTDAAFDRARYHALARTKGTFTALIRSTIPLDTPARGRRACASHGRAFFLKWAEAQSGLFSRS